jgi:TRAP-type C4-dicarboxylate transport system substrate-binding protein
MLFRDEMHAAATVHDPSLEVLVLDLAEAKNLIGMAMLSVGASNYAARSPIMTIADFKGKKLRINGSELERQKMSRLGATGVAMSLSEVMPALSQGVIDGTISATSIFVAFKMIDLVKTVTVTNDTMLVTLAVVSKLWLDKLPPDLHKLVIDTGLATQIPAQTWEQDFSKRQEKEWNAMGGTVHTISPADQANLKTLLATVGDDATRSQPAVHEMLAKVRATAAKY